MSGICEAKLYPSARLRASIKWRLYAKPKQNRKKKTQKKSR